MTEKLDLLTGCITDITGPGGTRDYKAFQETFCARCRNPACVHAQWSKDKFGQRVTTQVDRFFHNPNQIIATADPRYAQIPDFISIFQEAIRLEASDRMGDWSIPKDIPQRAESPVDTAVENMMRTVESNSVQETDVAEESVEEAPEEEPVIVEALTPPKPFTPPTTPKIMPPRPGNTIARDGIMIGGGVAPQMTPTVKEDPWAIKPKAVQPGAIITMGGGEEKNP